FSASLFSAYVSFDVMLFSPVESSDRLGSLDMQSSQFSSLSILHFGRISKFQLQPSVKRSNFSAESSPSIRTPLDSSFLALKKYLPVRGEIAVLVLLCIQKFRRKPLDGCAECSMN